MRGGAEPRSCAKGRTKAPASGLGAQFVPARGWGSPQAPKSLWSCGADGACGSRAASGSWPARESTWENGAASSPGPSKLPTPRTPSGGGGCCAPARPLCNSSAAGRSEGPCSAARSRQGARRESEHVSRGSRPDLPRAAGSTAAG
ncbi:hypothetical protein KIL84_023003 [Mauremys mutica]|uniref:Uncharacterized protein n=1 Tax=Mauremys mutica TaxID=74926 RepID=A0A9D3WLS9_9SAUR|nr:hypothetical protein KIL84_023003 [Mauremys mutica]